MKAFIFNSGTGSRLGKLTDKTPKGLVELPNGESMLSRQIRLLKNAGIKEIVITTGPFEDQIISLSKMFPQIKFKFVNNNLYNQTNSIYSLYLSKKYIDDDFIILHGDLVFDSLLVDKMIADPREDLCLINTIATQPEKDFKGRINSGKLTKIAVDIFDDNCYALQPLYKFSKETMIKWLDEIEKFIHRGENNVYAENALNIVLPTLNVGYLDYKHSYIEEIDTVEDLHKVSSEFRLIDYENQTIINTNDVIQTLEQEMARLKMTKPLFVISDHLLNDDVISSYIKNNQFQYFKDFSPNPLYEEVLDGLNLYRERHCDSLVAIGGGSCIDVAKAIKLYSPHSDNYINKDFLYVDMPLVALPTTAGTGTESTRYAVIYYEGIKQSLVSDSLLPDVAILYPGFLKGLPEYHKKSSFLDAFCQAIESFWSINSNELSKMYSKKAIDLIRNNYQKYLNNDYAVYQDIFLASNFAGRAINITQTTAPHAMSYHVTSLTGIAHGHAVSIILPTVLSFMISNLDKTQDSRGEKYVKGMFDQLRLMFDVKTDADLIQEIQIIIDSCQLEVPKVSNEMIKEFTNSVNATRLKNSPITIDKESARKIYMEIFDYALKESP